MENYILWIVIAAYLFFVLLKNKKNSMFEKTQNKAIAPQKKIEEAVLTAAIAAAIGREKEFVIKNVRLVKNTDKHISSWKIAGRTETMMRKNFK